jgi:hypothetical protein
MRSLLNLSVAIVLGAFAPASVGAGVGPSATIVGTVTLTAADGGTWAGDGARVVLACVVDGTTRTEVADEHGVFRFRNVPIDNCSIEADVQGFVAQPVSVVAAVDQVIAIDLHPGIVPLRVGVNIGEAATCQETNPRRPHRSDAAARRHDVAIRSTR